MNSQVLLNFRQLRSTSIPSAYPKLVLNQWQQLCRPGIYPQYYVAIQTRKWSASSRCLTSQDADLAGHHTSVKSISKAVRQFYDRKEKFRINHGSTNSTRPRDYRKSVNTGALNHVLHVDAEKKTVLVEPNVPMDRLVEATLEHGLVPPVVMEFPGITVGGGYAGTAGESSSFKHGFFDQTVNYVEMVLADGTVVQTSQTEKPDLFKGAAGALGTLGITTMVELQLVQAKKYVETTYHPVSNVAEAIKLVQEFVRDPSLDYVDGILFSKTSGAIITGRMTDTVPSDIPIQTFSHTWDPWFYLHVQQRILQSQNAVTEAVPLAEYLFRYDRGGFWVGRSAFKYMFFPFNKLTRWFLDDFLHTRMLYSALHASGQSRNYVVQDLALPYSTAEAFINYTDTDFGIYPLWLCPLKTSPTPTIHPHLKSHLQQGNGHQEMLNIGLWGDGPKNYSEFIRLNKDLEHKLKELGGMKWLYAHTYYTEQEFWEDFDQPWYRRLREKYHATSLADVYDKVKIDVPAQEKELTGWKSRILSIWPVGGVWGIWKAIQSRSYIAARKSSWRTLG